MKGLMQRLLKNPLKQHLGAASLSPYHQESREQYSLQTPYSTPLVKPQYLLQSTQAQHPSSLSYPSVLRGYTSDMDHTANFGRGQTMDKGKKNKQGDLVATKVMVTVQHQKFCRCKAIEKNFLEASRYSQPQETKMSYTKHCSLLVGAQKV